MDSEQLKVLRDFVNRYFADEPLFTTATFRRFDALLQHINVELPELSTGQWSERAAAAALTMAGPQRQLLPSNVLQHFLEVTRNYHDTSQQRLLECAIAYGCGKWREVVEGGSVWEGIWRPSISQLSQSMEPAVKDVNLWLSDHVVGYVEREFWFGRDPSQHEGAGIIACDAMMLALQFIHPVKHISAVEGQVLAITCDDSGVRISFDGETIWQELRPGGRVVFELSSACQLLREPVNGNADKRTLEAGDAVNILATDDGARISFSSDQSNIFLKSYQLARLSPVVSLDKLSCTCGHVNCHGRHSLEGWNAGSRISLWSFCASAVKGPHVNVQTGTLTQGIYYSMLSTRGNFEGMRLRDVSVEYKLCQSEVSQHGDDQAHYEGHKCPSCHEPGNPATTPRKLYKRLILADEHETYKRVKRFRCQNNHSADLSSKSRIENFSAEPVCPMCLASLNKSRPSYVWVRVFNSSYSDDQKMQVLTGADDVDGSSDVGEFSYDSSEYVEEDEYGV